MAGRREQGHLSSGKVGVVVFVLMDKLRSLNRTHTPLSLTRSIGDY